MRRVELAGAIKQRRALDRLARKRSAAEGAEDQRRRQKEQDDLHATRAASEAPGPAGTRALTTAAAATPVTRQAMT